MSFDFFWFFIRLDQSHAEVVLPKLQVAIDSIAHPALEKEAIDAWRRDPDRWTPDDCMGWWYLAFKSQPTIEFGFNFFTKINPLVPDFELSADNTEALIIDRIPPAAILAFALGPERTARLPLHSGNAAVRRQDIEEFRDRVGDVFRMTEVEQREVRRRGAELLGYTNSGRQLDRILAIVPEQAERALSENGSLAMIATTQY